MAQTLKRILALSSLSQFVVLAAGSVIAVSSTPPHNTSAALPEAFVSYSIELAFLVDYTGTPDSPNTFSNNLLNNIGNLTGTKPYLRVGGNTQDFAIFNADLAEPIDSIYSTPTADYPSKITIGPTFFDSYSVLPDVKWIHGFNFKNATSNAGWQSLLQSAPVACKALGGGKLLMWEYGNEPDLYSSYRTAWSAAEYVSEWLNGTRALKSQIAAACPDLASTLFFGPSFASTTDKINPTLAFTDGLDGDKSIKELSFHIYIGGANQAGVTLQGTLMNHTSTVSALSKQAQEAAALAYTGLPYVLGEGNSLYNEGKPGLSNTFGAGLWGIDFLLQAASIGIRRVHMHQGTSYRYGFWQPIQATKAVIGTKPPYYGNIAVAATLGNLLTSSVQVANVPLPSIYDAAYATYVDGKLAKIAVINMREYNYTVDGAGDFARLNPVSRPSQQYSFQVSNSGSATIQRLYANGSDALSGITWDGWSYNWDLDNGKPVRLSNVTVRETAEIKNGIVALNVMDSSFAVLNFST